MDLAQAATILLAMTVVKTNEKGSQAHGIHGGVPRSKAAGEDNNSAAPRKPDKVTKAERKLAGRLKHYDNTKEDKGRPSLVLTRPGSQNFRNH